MTVRTRFAPSPTGYLHIGGVRTALFNWLLARRHGGQFILRIDDTDAARNVADALQPILDGFRWLGLEWDEGPEIGGPYAPYFQSQRGALYEKAIVGLIEEGLAYPCLATEKELTAARDLAKASKQPFVYRGPTRTLPPSESLAIYREKRPALRFKVPDGRTTVLDDRIRGTVEWQTDLLGDFTIARAGGQPLYNLASIVDDIDMRITHVVRAEEHLSNTHPQLLILEGLGGARPEFAHLPFVAAPGAKQKLSKRNPPPGVMVAIEDYQKAGYLPEALVNALARIGWSLDDKTEIMPRETIIANFSLDRVTKAPAALDVDKIFWMQDHYMRKLPAEVRVERMLAVLQADGIVGKPASSAEREKLARIIAACGDRLKLLGDIRRYADFLFRDQLAYDAKAIKTLKQEGARELIERLRDKLRTVDPFAAKAVESAVHELAQETGVGGRINHLLRAATTGRSAGAGVFDCVSILGQERTLRHLSATVADLDAGTLAADGATEP